MSWSHMKLNGVPLDADGRPDGNVAMHLSEENFLGTRFGDAAGSSLFGYYGYGSPYRFDFY